MRCPTRFARSAATASWRFRPRSRPRSSRAKIGTVEEVIIDEYDEAGLAIGRTKADSPEIDGKCYVETLTPYKPGDFVKVRITGSEEYDLVGTPEDEVQTS